MAFVYPESRYYYDWYAVETPMPPARPTDSSIKAAVVERLRKNLFTEHFDLRVDVKRGVVILAGVVDSRLAKRSAGDDCWDTVGVIDVSNQLEVAEGVDDGPEPVRDFMTTGVVALEADAPLHAVDRDIVVRAVAEAGDMTATKLGDICTDAVITVDPDDPVETPIRLMRDRAVRRIVVVEDDVPVGVLSMGDMARRRDPGSVLADIVATPANA